jgi:hypothetical protein
MLHVEQLPDTLQVHFYLGQQQPGPRERIEPPDTGELLQARLAAPHRTGNLAVEQLGYVPPQNERRDDALPGRIDPATGRWADGLLIRHGWPGAQPITGPTLDHGVDLAFPWAEDSPSPGDLSSSDIDARYVGQGRGV